MKKNPDKSWAVAFLLICCLLAFTTVMAFRNQNNIAISPEPAIIIDSAAGVPMTLADYNLAKTKWRNSHAVGAIQGGSISKDSLLELINSMPLAVNTVSFYFGTDKDGRTYVMFAPAGATVESKIFRNGSFCPNICN